MRDLDDLLNDGIPRYARAAATHCDIDALIRRGVGRRRKARVRLVTTAVLAVAVIVGIGVVALGQDDPDSHPVPAPATGDHREPQPDPRELTPQQIVHAEGARLEALAVSEDDSDVRASIWSLCLNERCSRHRMALAVTRDEFATSEYLPLPNSAWYPVLEPLRDDAFYLDADEVRGVLTPDGRLTRTTRPTRAGPLTEDETLLQDGVAVDQDGSAHRLSMPTDAYSPVQQTGGRIVATRGVGSDAEVVWSDDGGATWSGNPLSGRPSALYEVIESAEGNTIAVAEGTDGATLFPFVAVHVSRDGGATWDRVRTFRPDGELGYLAWAVVRPDGSLLTRLQAWSDDRRDDPSRRTRGPYRSAGLDWSAMHPFGTGLGGDGRGDDRRLQQVTDGDEPALYLSDDAEAYVSGDGGRTWQPTAAR